MFAKGKLIGKAVIMFLLMSVLAIQTFAVEIVEPPIHSVGYIATVNTQSSNLNVRSGPGTNYQIIGSLAKGTTVKIAGSNSYYNDTWMYIKSPVIGWVQTSYLTDFRTSNDW